MDAADPLLLILVAVNDAIEELMTVEDESVGDTFLKLGRIRALVEEMADGELH
jgi:hypothetical protein